MNVKGRIVSRYGTCSKDCYGSCVYEARWNDEALERKLLETVPLNIHPFTRGFFCPKFKDKELLYHPQRIRHPLIRAGSKGTNQFTRIALDQAIQLIYEKVGSVLDQQGPKSIIASYYAGNYGLISKFAPLRFFKNLGTSITVNGLCNEAGCHSLQELFGTYSLTNPFQMMNADCKLLMIWNSNLSDRNVHVFNLIKEVIKRGTKLVVMDSRKHHTAEIADIFIQPHPGTEDYLAYLIMRSLMDKDKFDEEFIEQSVSDAHKIFIKLQEMDLDEYYRICGVNQETINELVSLLIEFQHKTLFNVGFGAQKYFNGGSIMQAIAMIQVMLGNIGKPGTGLIYDQGQFNEEFGKPIRNYLTKSQNEVEFHPIPLIMLGSYLKDPLYRLLFIYNFNPASSLPNQSLLREALLRKDLFVVVHDLFLNETTKYADVVIPAKFSMETDEIFTPYYIPGISINQGGPCPYPECLSNYELFQQLTKKFKGTISELYRESHSDDFRACLSILPPEIQKILQNKGFYLRFNEEAIPYDDGKFPTLSGKIELKNFIDQKNEELIKFIINRKHNQFILITPSHKFFLHSQLGQFNAHFQSDFQKVYLNSADIKTLNLTIKEKVVVSANGNQCEYFVEKMDSLKPGVALIYSGTPFISTITPNVNFLTSGIPESSEHSGSYNSNFIEISKIT